MPSLGYRRSHVSLRDFYCSGSLSSQEQNMGHFQDIGNQRRGVGRGDGMVCRDFPVVLLSNNMTLVSVITSLNLQVGERIKRHYIINCLFVF